MRYEVVLTNFHGVPLPLQTGDLIKIMPLRTRDGLRLPQMSLRPGSNCIIEHRRLQPAQQRIIGRP